MKKIILAFGVTLALLFTGCGEADLGSTEDGEKRIEIQKLTDEGAYDQVISKLSSAEYQNAYPDSEYKLYLGSAYLSRAGFTLSVVLDLFTAEDDGTETASESSGAGDLLVDLADKINLADAIRASTLFKEAIPVDCGNSDRNYVDALSSGQKEVCLFVGITGLMKTAVTFSYLTDDLSSFFEESDSTDGTDSGVPSSMLATACALEYALVSSPKSAFDDNTSTFECSNDANLSIDGNVNFPNNPDYEHVTITVDENNTFSQLINYSAFLRSSILIKDKCSINYSACDTIDYQTDGSGCYACPVAKTAAEVEAIPATNEILLETINNDIEALVNMLPADLLETDDIDSNESAENVIEEFKQEITGGEDREITEADLLNYFNDSSDDSNTTGNYCVEEDADGNSILGTVDNAGVCQPN